MSKVRCDPARQIGEPFPALLVQPYDARRSIELDAELAPLHEVERDDP